MHVLLHIFNYKYFLSILGGRSGMFTAQDLAGPSGIAQANNHSSILPLPPSEFPDLTQSKTLSGKLTILSHIIFLIKHWFPLEEMECPDVHTHTNKSLAGFSGTKAVNIQTSADSNEATNKTFESLFLKKIGSTKPRNETRRLVHAEAAIITSDEYAQKIEELTKPAPAPKSKSKSKSKSTEPKKQSKQNRAPKSKVKSSNDSPLDKENISPDIPLAANEPNENVGENDYALCKESNGDNYVCFIERVLPNLEEAVGLRFVKVSSESVSQAFKVDGPCLVKISAVVKNAGKPDIVPTPSGVHYVFEALS